MAAADAKIRAFTAIEIGDGVRGAAAALIGRLREIPLRVSWVRPENLHVTLRFLGEIEQDRFTQYAEQVREGIAGTSTFEATMRGVGAFPNARRPSVIWAGLESQGESLGHIHEIAECAARSVQLPAEVRVFVPHITLGRVRRGSASADITKCLDAEKGFEAGAFTVEAVSLFSSELTPQGAKYTRLHRLTLNGICGARDL